ncbi:MAG: helix-turn-helix transcriptional regulator, partial [Steroidobacteraceae bacterium]
DGMFPKFSTIKGQGPMDHSDDPLLSATQTAAFFGITERSVYSWQKVGWLPPPDVVLPNGRRSWRQSTLVASVKPSAA